VVIDGEAVAGPSATSRPGVVMVGLSADQVLTVTHAVALFAEAGLALPPMVVHGSEHREGCDGRHAGFHRSTGWGSSIVLCSPLQDAWFRRVVLHELAHAWSAFGLSAQRREAFRVLRGWEHWMNYEQASWPDNGGEQAAEIIAWGVSDRAAPTLRIDHDSCAELRTGYVTLTGTEPLHGLTSLCGPSSRRVTVS
jgi:hypothetical protein